MNQTMPPAPEPMTDNHQFVLRAVSGRDAGRQLVLTQPVSTVGRYQQSDFPIAEHFASYVHLEIVWNLEHRRHEVICHGQNGMVIHDKFYRQDAATPVVLHPGNVIAIGGSQFVYECVPAAPVNGDQPPSEDRHA
jgi:hypothetical protein